MIGTGLEKENVNEKRIVIEKGKEIETEKDMLMVGMKTEIQGLNDYHFGTAFKLMTFPLFEE